MDLDSSHAFSLTSSSLLPADLPGFAEATQAYSGTFLVLQLSIACSGCRACQHRGLRQCCNFGMNSKQTMTKIAQTAKSLAELTKHQLSFLVPGATGSLRRKSLHNRVYLLVLQLHWLVSIVGALSRFPQEGCAGAFGVRVFVSTLRSIKNTLQGDVVDRRALRGFRIDAHRLHRIAWCRRSVLPTVTRIFCWSWHWSWHGPPGCHRQAFCIATLVSVICSLQAVDADQVGTAGDVSFRTSWKTAFSRDSGASPVTHTDSMDGHSGDAVNSSPSTLHVRPSNTCYPWQTFG